MTHDSFNQSTFFFFSYRYSSFHFNVFPLFLFFSPSGEKDDRLFELPISFCAKSAGLYSCNVVLKGPDDVRVHRIECLVVPEGSHAELAFHTPVHQPVTQNIPVVNQTNHDWPLKARLQGNGFFGPDYLLVKSHTKGNYPLMFKPMYEGDVEVSYVMVSS